MHITGRQFNAKKINNIKKFHVAIYFSAGKKVFPRLVIYPPEWA
jgi:hypothetical protein